MSQTITERVIYTGRVQGVGFRYSVRALARQFPVKGYVKNLPDGSVELVVQGAAEVINGLLAAVAGHFEGNIHHCERRVIEPAESFSMFEIRF
jgi:acylphosphatase